MKANGFMMAVAAIALTGLGCASSPPSELREARMAYRDAANGPAAEQAREELTEAKKALQQAESEFADEGNEQSTRNLAREAKAKAELAKQVAEQRIAAAETERQEAEEAARAAEADEIEPPEERPTAEAEPEIQAEMVSDLQDSMGEAEVTQVGDGVQIALSSKGTFASGSSQVSAEARNQLMRLAAVIQEGEETQPITVTGYTDSMGSEAGNRALSRERAEAVKQVLVSIGIPADRIQVVGAGEDSPIASNDTEEGRAKNRRVEIRVGGMPDQGDKE